MLALMAVVFLAFDRPMGLMRCWHSFQQAHRLSRVDVDIHIFLDGPPDLETRRVAMQMLCSGNATIHSRSRNAGTFRQYMHAIRQLSRRYQWLLILEDDVELSPHAIDAITSLVPVLNRHPGLYGLALQRLQWQLGITEKGTFRRLDLVDANFFPSLMAFPAVGTWGQLLSTMHLRSFLRWMRRHHMKVGVIEGFLHEKWRAERKALKAASEELWSYWFTRCALQHGVYNLYVNLPHNAALARSHREAGLYRNTTLGPQHSLLHTPAQMSVSNVTIYDYCLGLQSASFDAHAPMSCPYRPGRYPFHTE